VLTLIAFFAYCSGEATCFLWTPSYFAGTRPWLSDETVAAFGSLVFGGLSIMRLYMPLGIPMQIYDIFPYLATVLVLVFTSIRQSKEHAMPKHCGLNYFREER